MKLPGKFYMVMAFLALSFSVSGQFVRADDDEDEDEREESREEEDSGSDSGSSKTVTKTIIVEPEKIVTSTIWQDVQLPDSDRDGLADESDPHPDIAEYLIVADSNFDGIDDRYELQT